MTVDLLHYNHSRWIKNRADSHFEGEIYNSSLYYYYYYTDNGLA